ncbi:MAG: outer membrane beta-barrel protein [Candidatus Kapaibacterium sp.]
MKKLSLAILLSLGSMTLASAPRAQMQFAVTGGLNFAYFNQVPPVTDAISSLGYMIGLRGSIGSNIFFEPSIEYVSFGSTVSTISDATSHKMRSNYIRIPLQAGVKLFDDFPVNIEARAGIGESFLVGYDDQATGVGKPFTKSDINTMRTTGIIGGGIRVFFLKLDLEYEWGLTPYFKNKGGTEFRAFYIILGGNF